MNSGDSNKLATAHQMLPPFITAGSEQIARDDLTAPNPGPQDNGNVSVTTAQGATGDLRIDGILYGIKWSGAISYSDPDASTDYQAGYSSDQNGNGISAHNESFSQFTAQQMVALHATMNTQIISQLSGSAGFSVAGFTGLAVTYAGSGASSATIRAANSGDPYTAYAYYPHNSIYGGDTFFGSAYDGTVFSYKTPVTGNYA